MSRRQQTISTDINKTIMNSRMITENINNEQVHNRQITAKIDNQAKSFAAYKVLNLVNSWNDNISILNILIC